MPFATWAVGVTAAPRTVRTLDRTLDSLAAAGFPMPRVFADGDVSVPHGYEVTRREPPVGGWPNFWLALTELVSRVPRADVFLIVQDDVVFCKQARDYASLFDTPDDCGVFSLFCPACYNGPQGWNAIAANYQMAGGQTLALPRERAYAFLGHPWTANHRRAAPRSKHFRGDGLHHIDGAVGQWCHRVNLAAYFHSPSLCQHIGTTSIMYPGFDKKRKRRFADSFPGEQAKPPIAWYSS